MCQLLTAHTMVKCKKIRCKLQRVKDAHSLTQMM